MIFAADTMPGIHALNKRMGMNSSSTRTDSFPAGGSGPHADSRNTCTLSPVQDTTILARYCSTNALQLRSSEGACNPHTTSTETGALVANAWNFLPSPLSKYDQGKVLQYCLHQLKLGMLRDCISSAYLELVYCLLD